MNVVTLYGRLTKDPDLRYSQSGMANVFFTVAVDRGMSREKRQEAEAQGRPTTDFIPCKAFGKTAELLGNYFHKGDRIAIEGNINTGSYEKDGQRFYTTDVIVNRVHFVETAKESGAQVSGKDYANNPNQGFAPQGYYPVDEGDIPFL